MFWIALLLALGLAIGFGLDYHEGILKFISPTWKHIIRALVVLVVGAGVSRLLERRLFALSTDRLGAHRSSTIRYVTRLLLYTGIVLTALGALGAGLPSVVFGGAFVTVVIGLAGQTVFSNVIAGIWIIIFRPFRVGDSIGIITWQYPVLMPSFPHEALRPTYAGRVADINLMYTELENGDGYPHLIPNGILIQAFIENRSRTPLHRVRMRFDVAFDVDAGACTRGLRTRVGSSFPNGQVEVFVADVYPTAYSVIVIVTTSERDDTVRDRVLQHALEIMGELRGTAAAGAAQTGPTPAPNPQAPPIPGR